MGLKSTPENMIYTGSIDGSLAKPPVPDIAIDQLMAAVENTRPYVRTRLLRTGLVAEIDDVMQDVRIAAWEGLLKGSYRHMPGIPFGGWVQGIAVHLCADHMRRRLTHPWMSLTADSESLSAAPVDFATTESVEQIVEHEWAAEVLTAVRRHVAPETWESAVQCLTTPRGRHAPGHKPGWEERKRWCEVTKVRQTAFTVRAALEVEPDTLHDEPTLIATAVCCLPTLLLQVIAERLVLTGVRGAERAAAISELSAETGVSEKYVEGRIGQARNLYLTAFDVLDHAASKRNGSVAAGIRRRARAEDKVMS